MGTDMSTPATTRLDPVRPGRLWFGFAASAAAWMGLGLADILITWKACMGQEQFGGASAHPGMRILSFVITLALLAVAVTAGVMSYRNWRRLSGEVRLRDAEGKERREFMALLGVFVSLTLGVGILWLGVPLLVIELCVRTR